MMSMDKILAAGASIIIRPKGSESLRFLVQNYAVAIEYQGFRQGLVGDDLEEMFGRGLKWMEEVDFFSGSQWTPEQIKQMERACS